MEEIMAKSKKLKTGSDITDLEQYFLEFSEKTYYRERDEKHKLYNRLSIILAALSIVFACAVKIYNAVPTEGCCLVLVCFWIFTGINVISLGIVGFFFYRIIFIGDYDILASPKDIKKYSDQWCDYHGKKDAEAEAKTLAEIKSYLINEYTKCAESWYEKNIKLAEYVHEATKWAYIMIFSIVLTLCCYVANNSFLINDSNPGECAQNDNVCLMPDVPKN